MAFKKKTSTGASQDFASSNRTSGNNPYSVVTDPMNWPKQGFTVDNEVTPELNVFPPQPLSKTPQAFRDGPAKVPKISSYRSTLG